MSLALVSTSICRFDTCVPGMSSLLIVAKVPVTVDVEKYVLEIQRKSGSVYETVCKREYTPDKIQGSYIIDVIDCLNKCAAETGGPADFVKSYLYGMSEGLDTGLLPSTWSTGTITGGNNATATIYEASEPTLLWLTGFEWSFSATPSSGSVYLQLIYSVDGTENGVVLYNIKLSQPSGSIPGFYIPVAFGTPGYLVARLYNDKGLDFAVNVSYKYGTVQPPSSIQFYIMRMVLSYIDAQGNMVTVYDSGDVLFYPLHVAAFSDAPAYAAPIMTDPATMV